MRGFKDSLAAGLEEAVLDDVVGGLGGGLTGLCRVLGILGVTAAGVAGFCWLMVANPLAALSDETVTEGAGTFAGSSVSSGNFRFLLVPCSDSATACGRNS